MDHARLIDENGYFIEDVIIVAHNEDGTVILNDGRIVNISRIVYTPCPDGFYLPRWNGNEYAEGATQEYIDSLIGVITQPTTEEKLEELALNVNDALLAIMMLSIE